MSAYEAGSSAAQPERELLIREGRRQPTAAAVNATMARLGLDVEWSEEAVEQLVTAASAAREYVRRHPERAQALVHDPEAVLQALRDEGLLSTPVEALEAALAQTRRQVSPPRAGVRLAFEVADG
jgi:hypothetical protein